VSIRFEPLSRGHDRKAFSCGVAALDDWFFQRASQDEKQNVARVFVAIDDEGIAGSYSLSMFTFTMDSLPESSWLLAPSKNLVNHQKTINFLI
jgi:hypothetical protein